MNKFFLAFAFLFSSVSHAEVKTYMDKMLMEIFTLKPFIVSEADFKDPKNSVAISASLKNMAELSDKVTHEDKIRKTGFAVPSQVLSHQFHEIEHIYRVGNKDYSLWMLRSTLSVCMSCHTQLPSTSTKFDLGNKNNFLAKAFDEAEFLFIVRNFDKAIPLYDKVINSYPDNGATAEQIDKSLSRKAYYFIRVKQNLKDFVKSLEKNARNRSLPTDQRQRVASYIAKAKKMDGKDTFPQFTAQQTEELRAYAESQLKSELNGEFTYTPDRDVEYLVVSSVLYSFLDKNPDTAIKPDILYWLSYCERRFDQQAFYSLPELYLKQCVNDFPKSSAAPACFKEYKELITAAYTGSSGTHMPADVKKELKSMQNKISKAKK